jgi:aldehyde dehydrogenase (NAD+)
MSSQSAVFLAECASAAGIPAGVFNVIVGRGQTLGPSLLAAPEGRAVSFTGSGRVGGMVASAAAARNIRYQTEMGGKNVAIVMPNADIRVAAALTAAGAMRYAGQKCTATSRVVVAREVEGPFLDELRSQVAALPIGPVTDASSAVGPVISAASRASIREVLSEMDAESIYVGDVSAAQFDNGYFLPPTIVRNAAADSALAQRELFGPVLASFTASDLDHAIDLANSTPYGLSASLFTKDLRSALRYIDRIEAGMVRVNGDTTGVDPHAPFGGMKSSSSGSREQGPAARDFYTETKTVQINP